jgi:saccharopine dehydrogenase (NADP+, L-glutamate forming)/spermidine synthase
MTGVKRVVVFGSGRVAAPAVRTLLETGHAVVVATDEPSAARRMIGGRGPGEVLELDAADAAAVRDAVRRADAALSLLPVAFHARVAAACLAEGRPCVTTSYVSAEMRVLDAEARRAGVLLLNEVGADPGIDHMLAMRAIHRLQAAGATITGFRSLCGGIPAPEACDNPFRYKVSWSPRGVVLAGARPARFRRDGEVVRVAPGGIFDHAEPVAISGLGPLECYPNGDALRFEEEYGLHEPCTMLRGTLRWPGWCETWAALCRLGWVDETPDAAIAGSTFAGETLRAAGSGPGTAPRAAVATRLGLPPEHAILDRMEWLGLFDQRPVPSQARSRADLLADRLEARMAYLPGERDLVVLSHDIRYESASGEGSFRASLVEYGEAGGDTAMSRLVGLPAALAARRILDGTIREAGVRIPVSSGIYGPILADLEAEGIVERVHDTAPA